MRPALTPSERRAIVDAHAKRKSLLVTVCMMCGRVKGAPQQVEPTAAGISDGLHAACVEAYKTAYGFTSKKRAA